VALATAPGRLVANGSTIRSTVGAHLIPTELQRRSMVGARAAILSPAARRTLARIKGSEAIVNNRVSAIAAGNQVAQEIEMPGDDSKREFLTAVLAEGMRVTAVARMERTAEAVAGTASEIAKCRKARVPPTAAPSVDPPAE